MTMTVSRHRFGSRTVLALALGTLTFGTLAADPASAGDARVIRRCTAIGAGDISMSARFEARGDRKRFDVEFEAATPGRFRVGALVAFTVAGVRVGQDRLAAVLGGDIVGELNLDSRVREADDDHKPLPANFPAVGAGTLVNVLYGGRVVLGCSLR